MMASRLSVVGLALVLVGCAAKAQTPMSGDGPALVAPSPPARVIVPVAEVPTVPVPEDPAPQPTTPATPASGRSSSPPNRPTSPPPATPPEATPPPLLMSSGNVAAFEKRIRAQMSRAETALGQLNRATLGADARAQFDAAQGFLRQAEDALKVRNLLFAGQLADKAATLATRLKG